MGVGRLHSPWQTTGPMMKWCVIVCRSGNLFRHKYCVHSVHVCHVCWSSLVCQLVNCADLEHTASLRSAVCFSVSYRMMWICWTPGGTATRVTWGWSPPKGQLCSGITTFLMEEVGRQSVWISMSIQLLEKANMLMWFRWQSGWEWLNSDHKVNGFMSSTCSLVVEVSFNKCIQTPGCSKFCVNKYHLWLMYSGPEAESLSQLS